MATVYDGNKIGILPGGTTRGAQYNDARCNDAYGAGNGKHGQGVHHATQRHGRLVYLCFSDSTGLTNSPFGFKSNGAGLNITGPKRRRRCTPTASPADDKTCRSHLLSQGQLWPIIPAQPGSKRRFGITDTTNDLEISLAIQAASQMIENEAVPRVWIPARLKPGTHTAVNHQLVVFDDIASSASGRRRRSQSQLTWTETARRTGNGGHSDYVLMPRNAALNGEPYTSARRGRDYTFPLIQDGVKIVAQFGYAPIPSRHQSRRLASFRRCDYSSGVTLPWGVRDKQFGNSSYPALDPDLKLLIAPFKRLGVP